MAHAVRGSYVSAGHYSTGVLTPSELARVYILDELKKALDVDFLVVIQCQVAAIWTIYVTPILHLVRHHFLLRRAL